jgi:hypothetical protein
VALCRALADAALQANATETVFRVLQHVLSCGVFEPTTLSPLHPLALHLSLSGPRPSPETAAAARSIASAALYDVGNPRETGLVARDATEYFYYAGLVQGEERDWAAAADAFRGALLVPAQSLSAIAVEAYKLWALASLLATPVASSASGGLPLAVPALPRGVSRVVGSALEPLAPGYSRLARAFANLDHSAITKVIDDTAAEFAADGTSDWSALVVDLAARIRVARLAQTYAAAPLAEVAAAMGPGTSTEAATATATAMISEGQLSARLDAAAGVLVFGKGEPAVVGDGGGQRAGRGPAGTVSVEAAAAGARAGGAAMAGPSSSLASSPLAARLQEELDGVLAAVSRLREVDDDLAAHPANVRKLARDGMLGGSGAGKDGTEGGGGGGGGSSGGGALVGKTRGGGGLGARASALVGGGGGGGHTTQDDVIAATLGSMDEKSREVAMSILEQDRRA